MIAYEIDTGADGGSWGFTVHRYEVGRGYGTVYLGEWLHGGGFGSEEDARRGAEALLDSALGEREEI